MTSSNDDYIDIGSMPESPDPFWPSGVAPSHLTVAKQQDTELVKQFTEVTGPIWHCEKCGAIQKQSMQDKRYCVDCLPSEAQNSAVAKMINANWMEEAKELGIAIFERQPEETEVEWRIWTAYRNHYPLSLPTWSQLSNETGCAVATIVRAAAKWSYKVRLVAWAQFTDGEMQEKRIAAIKEMNQKQLDMSQTIMNKLKDAIDILEPALLKPNEIVNLFKVATELERKIVSTVEEKVESTALESKSRQLAATKPEDLAEVVQILQKTGLLDGKIIGVEQTTRIIAKEE